MTTDNTKPSKPKKPAKKTPPSAKPEEALASMITRIVCACATYTRARETYARARADIRAAEAELAAISAEADGWSPHAWSEVSVRLLRRGRPRRPR